MKSDLQGVVEENRQLVKKNGIIEDFHEIEKLYSAVIEKMGIKVNIDNYDVIIAPASRFNKLAVDRGYSSEKSRFLTGFTHKSSSSMEIVIRSRRIERVVETLFHEIGHTVIWGIDKEKKRVIEETLAFCFGYWAMEEINKDDFGIKVKNPHKRMDSQLESMGKEKMRKLWPVHYAAINVLDFYRKFFWGGKSVANEESVKYIDGRSFRDLYSILVLMAFEDCFNR